MDHVFWGLVGSRVVSSNRVVVVVYCTFKFGFFGLFFFEFPSFFYRII
jgi:hypothetical protein